MPCLMLINSQKMFPERHRWDLECREAGRKGWGEESRFD
jgi:hypothetical protein